MALPDGAQQVFAQVMRIAPLSPGGNVAIGANVYTTNTLVKLSLTPAMETGVDLVTLNANGDIASHYKHGDMPKYYNVTIDMTTPDPILHQFLSGGVNLQDTSVALTTPGTVTATPATTGGTLASGSYAYIVTAANQYGETLGSAATTATVTGPTGAVALSLTPISGAVYYRWYGRTASAEQFIAQTTSASFTDTGAIVPFGALPTANTTGGPGADTGYQSPALGIVGNIYGVSVELWGQAILNGTQAPYLPFWRWVIPGIRNLQPQQRDFAASLLPNQWTGQAFENLSWGSGPIADWQFDSTKVFQYARASAATVPVAGWTPVAATN